MEERVDNQQRAIESRLPADVRLQRVRYDAARTEAWMTLLSREERARLQGYRVEKRQREFLLGRVAARQLLADVLGGSPQAVPLVVAENGAPEVRDSDYCVSISHTGDEAVAVAGQRAVGVDLEAVRERPERLHRFLLSEEERPLLHRLSLPEPVAFVLCWTLKEAALKALRCGLRRSPKIVRITELNTDAGVARLATGAGDFLDARFERGGRLWLTVVYEASDTS